MSTTLFDSIQLGNTPLKNRIVMAPMTRSRAGQADEPTDMTVKYYKQRASAGLIITEGTSPSAEGKGYARTPGIYSDQQIIAWRQVTDAVHQAGSKIFLQIMHVGRVAHPLNKASAAKTVAPSAIQAAGKMYTDQQGLQDMVMPHALALNEIPAVINEFKQATENAFAAGFDGVELHAASGYLPMQFLSSNTNVRTDAYGGTASHRIRFVVETLEAMASVKGANKVGIRIWPGATFNDIHDENPMETYITLLKAIDTMGLAYAHVVRSPDAQIDAFKLVRDHYNGISIINGGLDYSAGQNVISSGLADLVSYASLYISNPDLVERFRQNVGLISPDPNTFYTPGPQGYIDYPFLDGSLR